MNTAANPGAIHLHIDSLVLRGFAHINEAALSTALQQALSRELCSVSGLQDVDLRHVRTSVTLPERYNATTVGGVLAKSLSGIASSGMTETPESRHA